MSTVQHRIGIESLAIVPVVVEDLDEAMECYTETLGFEPRMDEEFEMNGENGRLVTVGVPGDDLQIGLMTAEEPYYDDETRALLGEKLGSQTWYTFRTEDAEATVAALDDAGVEITRDLMADDWGIEAMFADPFGNQFTVFESAGE